MAWRSVDAPDKLNQTRKLWDQENRCLGVIRQWQNTKRSDVLWGCKSWVLQHQFCFKHKESNCNLQEKNRIEEDLKLSKLERDALRVVNSAQRRENENLRRNENTSSGGAGRSLCGLINCINGASGDGATLNTGAYYYRSDAPQSHRQQVRYWWETQTFYTRSLLRHMFNLSVCHSYSL